MERAKAANLAKDTAKGTAKQRPTQANLPKHVETAKEEVESELGGLGIYDLGCLRFLVFGALGVQVSEFPMIPS